MNEVAHNHVPIVHLYFGEAVPRLSTGAAPILRALIVPREGVAVDLQKVTASGRPQKLITYCN